MKLILGTMTFGDQVDQGTAKSMLELFFDAGKLELDSAHTYCEGRTEAMLGRLLPGFDRRDVSIASKVHPWNDQGLQPRQVKKQLAESLDRLGREQVDLLYLHSPDLETPIAKTLEACFELFQAGKFSDFGLSNFAAWQVAEVVELCRANGWMQPRIYQGMYNALTRDVERELFPCLRNYGMSFYAYNPLAGGLLTGKHATLEDIPQAGRFEPGRGYLERYWREDYFDVMQALQQCCRQQAIEPVEVALSWLVNHSLLDAERGDGIILGASSIAHLRQNLAACERPTLHPSIVEILDRGWEIIKPNCFRYFRP